MATKKTVKKAAKKVAAKKATKTVAPKKAAAPKKPRAPRKAKAVAEAAPVEQTELVTQTPTLVAEEQLPEDFATVTAVMVRMNPDGSIVWSDGTVTTPGFGDGADADEAVKPGLWTRFCRWLVS